MTASNKYPNADTSPERLAEIVEIYEDGGASAIYEFEGRFFVRDLLAMLAERNEHTTRLKKTVKEQGKQLHDQRWRRLSDEEPGLSQIIDVYCPKIPDTEIQYVTICFGVVDTDEEWEWWRPIPPLPRGGDVK